MKRIFGIFTAVALFAGASYYGYDRLSTANESCHYQIDVARGTAGNGQLDKEYRELVQIYNQLPSSIRYKKCWW